MNLMVKCAFLLVSIANFAIAQQGQRPPVTQRAQAPQGQQEARYLVLKDIVVIDATGAAAKPAATVIISGNRITAIGDAGKLRIPKNSLVVEATGKFLVPGLWDMHGHLCVFRPIVNTHSVST